MPATRSAGVLPPIAEMAVESWLSAACSVVACPDARTAAPAW